MDLQRVAVGFWDPYQSLAIGLKEIESPATTMINSLSPNDEWDDSLRTYIFFHYYYGVFSFKQRSTETFINISDSSISLATELVSQIGLG